MGAGVLAGTGASIYAQSGAYWLEVERHDLHLPKWDADDFRIAVLADPHVNGDKECDRAIRAAEMALAEKPDAILLPGDYITYSNPRALVNIKRFLEPLNEATCPCLAILGNHDYWSWNVPGIEEAFRGSKVKLLKNEVAEVGGVSVAGIDDALMKKARYGVLRDLHLSTSLLTMLHEPDYVSDAPDMVSLQISGHSHGGQMCLPFGVALHTPLGARKYIAGFYPEADVPLYVSRGVGTIGPDYRLFCRPEVSILTLRSAAG